MHHACLIIAHNEFEVLQLLVSALDDVCNDIYVHIDRKVKTLPSLSTSKSRLYMLDKRIDVRWGDYSQILCEFLLWETALANGPYEFYHLISGTHLPLKSQDDIHLFFDQHVGNSLFSNLEPRSGDYYEILKLHRINLFTRNYASANKLVARMSQFLWKSFIAIQRWLNITINDGVQFYWANNWCSLSNDAVAYLVNNKRDIIRRYRWSFCGDEWFAPTELMASSFKEKVINTENLLYGAIGRSNAPVLTMADAEDISKSNCCFGRKFTSESKDLIEYLRING